jgi:hypothetical protein
MHLAATAGLNRRVSGGQLIKKTSRISLTDSRLRGHKWRKGMPAAPIQLLALIKVQSELE